MRAQGLQGFLNREERGVGRGTVLIASCFWVAASLTPAWSASPGEAQQGGDYALGAFAMPYPSFLSEGPESPLYVNMKGSQTASQIFSSTLAEETDQALQRVKARYEIDLGNYSFEFSGGYFPGMRSPVPSVSPLDPRAHLGYINLTIPLSQFYFRGGAFLGQNVESLGLIFKRSSEEQKAKKRELFGYQIGGEYRFSESLSIQAGWGQATQEYEMTRESLGAWYLRAQIGLGRGMSIIPQVGFVDTTSGDGPRITEEAVHFGAKWHINF